MVRVLITGAASGIGRATAAHLAGLGHDVVATARRIGDLGDLPAVARGVLDVADDKSVEAAVAAAGAVDVLVNCAGVSVWGAAELIPMASAERLVQTNYLGVVRMTRAVLPGMRERGGGRIIQISSTGARRPGALMSLYASSKAAVDAYSFAVRQEVWEMGIRVSVLGMAAVATDFARHRETVETQGTAYAQLGALARARAERAKGLPCDPQEVAEAVAALIDDPEPPFRSYVGEESQRLVARLGAMSDAELDRTMLDALYSGEAG